MAGSTSDLAHLFRQLVDDWQADPSPETFARFIERGRIMQGDAGDRLHRLYRTAARAWDKGDVRAEPDLQSRWCAIIVGRAKRCIRRSVAR